MAQAFLQTRPEKIKAKSILKKPAIRSKRRQTKNPSAKLENLQIWPRENAENPEKAAIHSASETPKKSIFPTGQAPCAGSSYNPNKRDRAEALKRAYSVHQTRIAENQRVEAALATYHSIALEQEKERVLLKSEKPAEKKAEKDRNGERGVKRKTKPRTRVRLNKKKRLALEKLALGRRKAEKRKLADVDRIGAIVAELDEAERVLAAKRENKRKEEAAVDESEILAVATFAKSSAACLRTVDALPKRASLKGFCAALSAKLFRGVG